MQCEYCKEEVLPGEGNPNIKTSLRYTMHHECLFRCVAGSVAHIRHECGCYVKGSDESDPPGMTLREGAKAALEEWRKVHPDE